MASYGNILTVFNADDQGIKHIETTLIKNNNDFTKIDITYFVKTNSKKNTRDLISKLHEINVDFVFFHNNISDGSQIKTSGINPETEMKLKTILLN
jgi:hypothetical protein